MIVRHMKKHIIATVAIAFALLLSACGTNTGSSSSQTAGQVLQGSLNAMKQLKAVHIDMKFAGGFNYGTTGTTGTPTAHPITVNLTASGDEVRPDKDIMHLNAGQGYSLSEITVGNKVYIQNTKGQWYVLDTSAYKGSSTDPFASLNASSYDQLLSIAQKATITDHGDQLLNGVSLRHITVVFGKDALKALLDATGETSKLSATQQQNLNKFLNNIKLVNPTLDLWIDEATHYVHQMEVKFSMTVDTSSLVTPTTSTSSMPGSISTSVDTVIDYSKFNESITISAPANAIPTSNPRIIFGTGA